MKITKANFAAVAAIGLLMSSQTSAAVLDFDGPYRGVPVLYSGYGGLDWRNFIASDGSEYPDSGYRNGIVSQKNAVYNYSLDAGISTIGNEAFDFRGAYLTAAWSDGLEVLVEGYSNDGLNVYSKTVVLDADAPTYFDFGFYRINSLRFVSLAGENMIMDDFNYEMSGMDVPSGAIPEPGSLALVALGFTGVLFSRRSKNKK